MDGLTREDVQEAYKQWMDASTSGNQKHTDMMYQRYKDLETKWKESNKS